MRRLRIPLYLVWPLVLLLFIRSPWFWHLVATAAVMLLYMIPLKRP